MLKARLKYCILIIIVIIVGLLSRKVLCMPQWVGDLLWAFMVYLMVRVLLIKASTRRVAIISIAFCFIIELSQLYQAYWLNQLRQTLPGQLILGKGFLWSDLVAYIGGVVIGLVIERYFITRYCQVPGHLSVK
ncbi:DUF2809 domain-containing protein [Mucilaginibacter terrae]|uniref:ribosomal maturation YjgA family protein n=1 Tax=Mucilaginibacter terrae TaxID=1955052 RepID=UPI00362C965D